MKPYTALLGAAAGTHAADQLALASLPLTATLVLDAGPDVTGLLVAMQSAAWLLLSLPAGAWVDRWSRRRLLIVALSLGLLACIGAIAAAAGQSALLLGLAAFAGAAGTVIYVLTALSLLPSLVPPGGLPKANAGLELARAVVSLAAPVAAGLLSQLLSPTWGYALAAAGAGMALLCVLALPRTEATPRRHAHRAPLLAAIQVGARFVAGHQVLRAIALCAVCWNFAFFALLAVWAPLALGVLALDPAETGLAQSAYGAGLILGALAAPHGARHLPPRAILLFGPSVSVVAILLLVAPGQGATFSCAAAAHFLIGFGPMMWLICQTTVRQLATPEPLMGRVNATLQTAIYGVRPLGALAGGLVAAHAGFSAVLLLVLVAFGLSTLVVLLSPLARMQTLPEPAAAC